MQVEVYMAAHVKQDIIPFDYIKPIQAGAALSDKKLYDTADNEGDNISAKNETYCELTALYWMWKNSSSEYCGLCHYRRFFDISLGDAEEVLSAGSTLVPRKAYLGRNLKKQYLHNHNSQTWSAMLDALNKDYRKTADEVFGNNIMYPYNMFIGSRSFIDGYCAWLFGILAKVDSAVDIAGYSGYQKRYAGFLAERLFTLYIVHNKIDTEEVNIIDMNKNVISQSRLRRLRNNVFYKIFGGGI